MSSVTKAIIPVAGLGTRMLPATKAIPKEMLPLVDKPLIQYIVEECIAAGIKDIVLVTHSSKNAIENHFDTSFELEAMLEQRVKRQLLEEVKSICPSDVSIMAVRQSVAKGLGNAILCARPLIGDSPFAVLLPDVIVTPGHGNLKTMLQNYQQTGMSQIMVAPVPWDEVANYGVADCQGAELKPGNSHIACRVVEKPAPEDAPSNLAIVGRYVLSPDIWPLLSQTQPGAGDEIQLTDAIEKLMSLEPVAAFALEGKSHDCGNKLGYAQAFVEHALTHPVMGTAFREWLKMAV